MKRIKLFSVLTGILLVVISSSFTNKRPPSLIYYGFETGASYINPYQLEPITGGAWVYFTEYQNLVLLDQVTEICYNYGIGSRCKVQLPSGEEIDNVRFTYVSEYQVTIRIRHTLTTNPGYVDVTPDGKMLEYELNED